MRLLSSFSVHRNPCWDHMWLLFKIIILHLDHWLQMSTVTRWAPISLWNLPQGRFTIYFSIISHHKKKNNNNRTQTNSIPGQQRKAFFPKCLSDRIKYYGIVAYYGSAVMTRDTRQSWRIQLLYIQLMECWGCQGRCIPEQCTGGEFVPLETARK